MSEEKPDIAAQLAGWAQKVNDASPIKPDDAPPPPKPAPQKGRRKKKRRR